MKVKVLGCSGGIGGRAVRTTSLLVDDDTLIDAGSGVGDLDFPALVRIDRVFITHSHLDHIAFLPLLADTVGEERGRPIEVYATSATLAALRAHIFNGVIWPDFSVIPNPESPFLRFQEIRVGEEIKLPRGRSVRPLPVMHTVPAVGYHLSCSTGSLVFSGDTAFCPALLEAINAIENLRHFIVEAAFPEGQRDLARASRHLCPSELLRVLEALTVTPEIWITHLKPAGVDTILAEIEARAASFHPKVLSSGLSIEF